MDEKKFRCRLMPFFLVQNRAGMRTYCDGDKTALEEALEKELQSKLHQPRVRPGRRAGYHAKILVVGRTANCVGRRELSPIKDVEELRAKFQAQPFITSKPSPLKNREVKVTDALGS